MNASLTLRDILLDSARRWPGRPAVGWTDGEARTYAGFLDDASRWAAWAAGLGLRRGDRVVLLSESRPEWGAAYFGLSAAGYATVPVLPDFSEAQVGTILAHSGARAAVVSAKSTAKLAAAVAAAGIPGDFPRALLDDAAVLAGPGAGAGIPRPPDPAVLFADPVDPEDIAAVLYTSGTTGTSKGVVLTHGAVAWNAVAGMREGLGPAPEDVLHLSILPLAHTYECTFGLVGVLAVGGEIRYLNGPPVPSRLLAALKTVRPTMMLTVPLLMEKIYRSRVSGPLGSTALGRAALAFPPLRRILHRLAGKKIREAFGGRLRFFGIGGAPLAEDMERFLFDARFPYSVGYGLTESAPLIAGGDPKDMRFRSTGKVLPGVRVRIADPNPEGIGEIQASGPSLMKGYWNDPVRTAEAFTADGWLRTGDLGCLDGDVLFIRGRLKNVLLGSNGENIYPEEVEAVINGQEFVGESLALMRDGRLVARIVLDAERLAAELKRIGIASLEKAAAFKAELLESLRREANRRLSASSSIAAFIEESSPFQKTPSLKIKRFLYA